LVTSVIRAWNPATPMLIAPAMNTHMYTNPMTKKHIMLIKEECPWVEVLKPVEKVLVCGDIGMGGMREWTDIVEILFKRLGGANTDDEEDDENDNDNGAFDDEEDEDEEEEEEDEDQNK
jgi:phosphopantothenoylcysteine decarboxylase